MKKKAPQENLHALAYKVNTLSRTELKLLIDDCLSSGDTQTLKQLVELGINIFYVDTIFRLLLYPILLLTIPFIYLWSKPILYVRQIPAEYWDPRYENSGLVFSKDPDSLKTIQTAKPENLEMSDLRNLEDPDQDPNGYYYFTALTLILYRYGNSKTDQGARLIDKITHKPDHCLLLDYLIETLSPFSEKFQAPIGYNGGPDITDKSTLGEKMKKLHLLLPRHPALNLYLFALMIAYTPSIPQDLLCLTATQFVAFPQLAEFAQIYYDGYFIPQPQTLSSEIIPKLIKSIHDTNLQFKEAVHHFTAFSNIINNTYESYVAKPVASMILLMNKELVNTYRQQSRDLDNFLSTDLGVLTFIEKTKASSSPEPPATPSRASSPTKFDLTSPSRWSPTQT